MRPLSAYVDGIGVLGPGLPDWPTTAQILNGERPWTNVPTVLPVPQRLPAAERRRTGTIVKLALGVGLEASTQAHVDPAQLAAVFTSSGGDGQNCHEICVALATEERALSPTRFHNSVHNAAAGYWGIATDAGGPANALCAYDASFAAGLLEALTQVVIEERSVLLIAYDAGYPAPLDGARPIPAPFGVALVLAPEGGRNSVARMAIAPRPAPVTLMQAPLETLRASIPAARSLPLLKLLAARGDGEVMLEYLAPDHLWVEVRVCR